MKLSELFGNQANQKQVIKINVNNGYEPAEVKVKQGVPAKLVFKRQTESGCLAKVQSKDLNFSADLPLNQDVSVTINTDEKGTFDYACGMNMFHGKVVIE